VIGTGLSGLGGWLAEQHGWHYAFSLVGLAGMAYSVPLALLLRDAPRESPVGASPADTRPKVRLGEAVLSLFGRGSFVLLFIVFALLNLTAWTITGWLPVFLLEHFNLTQGAAGLAATGYTSPAAVPGLLIGGFWADRWSRTNGRARMFVTSIGLFCAVPGILLAATTNVFVLAILGLVIYRLFSAFFNANLMPVLCEIADPRYRATGYGLLNLVASVSGGVGIYFSGMVRDWKFDLQNILVLGAGGLLICAVAFYFIKPGRIIKSSP
jgi:MFS family permease